MCVCVCPKEKLISPEEEIWRKHLVLSLQYKQLPRFGQYHNRKKASRDTGKKASVLSKQQQQQQQQKVRAL